MAKRKNRVFKSRSKWSNITRSGAWPYLKLVGILALAAIIIFVFVAYGLPLLRRWITGEMPGIPLPEPTEQPNVADSFLRGEVLLGYHHRNIGSPVILGDTVYFSSGTDNYGSPARKYVYFNYIGSRPAMNANRKMEGLDGEFDNIRSMDVNADYIVYFDGKNEQPGGGAIRLYTKPEISEDAETQSPGNVRTLKEVANGYAIGLRFVDQKHITFIERTGAKQDKVYLMNIETLELTTLYVYEDNALGISMPGGANGTVCWAEPDPQRLGNERFAVIRYLNTKQQTPAVQTLTTDTYVHNPVTNGTSFAWMDGNEGIDTALFLSVEGSAPKRIAENVADVGIGDNFVAWSSKGVVYAYFWARDTTYTVSTSTEHCNLASVSAHAVCWYDITEPTRARDIFKYAILD